MERSDELELLVIGWFQAASRGDTSMVDTHISLDDGVRLIGSDPTELFQGGRAVADFLRGEVEGAGGAASFTPTDVEAFSEGTVGWATTSVTITLPDGQHVSPRWSSVFHLEDGVWKVVHTHASIGVPNEEIGWVYPDRAARLGSRSLLAKTCRRAVAQYQRRERTEASGARAGRDLTSRSGSTDMPTADRSAGAAHIAQSQRSGQVGGANRRSVLSPGSLGCARALATRASPCGIADGRAQLLRPGFGGAGRLMAVNPTKGGHG